MQAIIDRNRKTVRFFGAGTFEAREDIKKLGLASWHGDVKEWQVRHFSLTRIQLEEIFPGITVEELETVVDESTQAASTANPLIPAGVSVGELYARINAVLRKEFSGTLFVFGVLSQVKRHPSGAVYLDLTETDRPDQRISGVIRSHVDKVCEKLVAAGFQLEPQLQVMFEANVSLNARDGRISLNIVRIVHEYTLAKVAALREQTNERLKKEGLFQRNKSQKLAFLPRRLGIITSAGGTVIHDFRASLDEAKFGFELFWFQASVQGSEAKAAILKALNFFCNFEVDAVLIFRGGGSQAELSVFNDYDVARAVCLCPHPVIAAIGHQEDRSSVQDVSFREFGVPKDIGRFFAEIVHDLRRTVSERTRLLHQSGQNRLEQFSSTIGMYSSHLLGLLRQHLDSTEGKLGQLTRGLPLMGQQVVEARQRSLLDKSRPISALAVSAFRQEVLRFRSLAAIGREIGQFLEKMEMRLESFGKIFETADPAAQLRRGFAIVRSSPQGTIVTKGGALSSGQEIELEFQDGRRAAKTL